MVWLCKTKIWWQRKIVLYGYRQSHSIHKTNDIYKDIAEDFESKFDIWNHELDRPSKEKNKKVIGLRKFELGGKVMRKFVGLRAKTDSYLIDDGGEDKKAKDTKKMCHKKKT